MIAFKCSTSVCTERCFAIYPECMPSSKGPLPRTRAGHRWAQWRQLTSALGLGEDATALALNAVSRATLIFLQVPARAGTAHAILQVCIRQGRGAVCRRKVWG